MRFVLNKHLVCIVLVAFVSYILPGNVFADDKLKSGKKTADEAASMLSQETPPDDSARSLRYAVPMTGGYAQADSTEFDFPEDKKKHLYRDIAVFVIISAAVAYFVIKVFLEGDKDEEETDDGGSGKPPPPI